MIRFLSLLMINTLQSLLLFRSFFQVILSYTSIVKEPLVINRDYFNLLTYVSNLSKGSTLDETNLVKTGYHF